MRRCRQLCRSVESQQKEVIREFNERWAKYEASAGSNHKPLSKGERWAPHEVISRRGQLCDW